MEHTDPFRARKLLSLCGLALVSAGLSAASYYVEPGVGSLSNPGTSNAPWSTLEEVAASGKAFSSGDILVLRSGHHGSPTVRGINDGEVTVRAAEGATPTLKNLVVRAARGWRFQGLVISPETAPEFERTTLVYLRSDASQIVLEQCRLYTVTNTTTWSATDWDSRACTAVDARGPHNVLRGNHLFNIDFGISITGVSNRVERNVIENFSGDGLRGLGDYGVFEYNVVKNCYDVNGNHDDGFQSWSAGPDGVGSGVVRGIVLRGNRIVNYEDPAQPHRGTLQGIGCFDGFFEDWIVENNEILVDHWHGITLSGARNCRLVNNTVVDLNTERPGPPWIRIGPHKDGSPSTGNIVRNNLTQSLAVDESAATIDHNVIIDTYSRFFRDYERRDLRLKVGAPAVDAGSSIEVPGTDAGGVPRPLDGDNDGTPAHDVGAREFGHDAVDADTDRLSDAAEIIAGTSPLDPTDRLELQAGPVLVGALVVSWQSVSDRVYRVDMRDALFAGRWALPSGEIPGTGGELRYTNPMTPGTSAYLRLAVEESSD